MLVTYSSNRQEASLHCQTVRMKLRTSWCL